MYRRFNGKRDHLSVRRSTRPQDVGGETDQQLIGRPGSDGRTLRMTISWISGVRSSSLPFVIRQPGIEDGRNGVRFCLS